MQEKLLDISLGNDFLNLRPKAKKKKKKKKKKRKEKVGFPQTKTSVQQRKPLT